MSGVEVWLADAAAPHEDLAGLLDETESARHAAIQHPTDRRRFLAAHVAVRQIVARHLGVEPASIRWQAGPNGKPALVGHPLQVNLSHSGDLVLIAVTAHRPIGVDLQQVLPGLDVVAMAARFYPRTEAELVERDGPGRFAQLWARKEAVVKAAGDRLTRGLPLPVAGPPPLLVDHDGVRFRILDLAAPEGFRAAVALEGAAPFEVRAHAYPNAATQR